MKYLGYLGHYYIYMSHYIVGPVEHERHVETIRTHAHV